MSYHIDSDRADTIRERFGDPVQQGFSERFMRPPPCAAPMVEQAEINNETKSETTKGNER